MYSYLENVSFQDELGSGRCMHETEQRTHVVITSCRQHQLLHEGQGLLPAQRVGHHVVSAARAATLPEHVCAATTRHGACALHTAAKRVCKQFTTPYVFVRNIHERKLAARIDMT